MLAVILHSRYISILSIGYLDRSERRCWTAYLSTNCERLLRLLTREASRLLPESFAGPNRWCSDLVSNLEGQIGVALFDRSARYPKLTPAGAALLADARGIVRGVDFMKSRAKGMAAGLEPELSAVVDVFFPIEAITEAAKDFRVRFPGTPLRLYVEALGGVYQPVLDGRASLGIVGPVPTAPSSMTSERVAEVAFLMVAARDHPLASFSGIIPKAELAKHIQLVLTDRSELSAGRRSA